MFAGSAAVPKAFATLPPAIMAAFGFEDFRLGETRFGLADSQIRHHPASCPDHGHIPLILK